MFECECKKINGLILLVDFEKRPSIIYPGTSYRNLYRNSTSVQISGNGLPYYPAYAPHFYTLQHLYQGGGACYQRVHKPELFYVDAIGVERCGAWLNIGRLLSSVIKTNLPFRRG